MKKLIELVFLIYLMYLAFTIMVIAIVTGYMTGANKAYVLIAITLIAAFIYL